MSYLAVLKNPLKTPRFGSRCGWLAKFNVRSYLPCPSKKDPSLAKFS